VTTDPAGVQTPACAVCGKVADLAGGNKLPAGWAMCDDGHAQWPGNYQMPLFAPVCSPECKAAFLITDGED
jgi:hypothetical protein